MVNVTVFEVTLPDAFETIQRNLLPLFVVSVNGPYRQPVLEESDMLPYFDIFVHVLPPSVDTCHWHVGVGNPVVAMRKAA